MSSFPFNAKLGPIVLTAEATGPTRTANLNLILDTGATASLIDLGILVYIGFDPNQPVRRARMTTGSSAAHVPVFVLTRFGALGQQRFGFPIVGHSWPMNFGADGLLGLDFLRDQVLAVDFRSGQITLS